MEETEPTHFEIGDIVEENEVIAWYDDSPLKGIVIKIQRDYYHFFSEIAILGQDRLTIMWFSTGIVEELPSDLVTLVSRPI